MEEAKKERKMLLKLEFIDFKNEKEEEINFGLM